MKILNSLLIAATLACLPARAAVSAPEKLLPNDTLVLVTIPDYDRMDKYFNETPQAQFWKDPAMQPFKDKFIAKFRKDVLTPFEQELGVKFADYSGLLHGQLSFALTRNGWDGGKEPVPAGVLLFDSKGKSAELKKALAEVKKKWADGGKQMKTQKIRDVEFTTLIIQSEDIRKLFDKVFPDPNEGFESLDGPKKTPKNEKLEISFGQSDSLLIIGNSTAEIEKVIARQSGGGSQALADDTLFAANQASQFRDALFYGWVNIKTFVDVGTKAAKEKKEARANANADGADASPEKIMEALGVKGLKTGSFSFRDSGDGGEVQFFLGVPASERKGLFKMFSPEPKDSSPPAFIPSGTVAATRYRLDLQKLFSSIESLVGDLNPGVAGMMKMMIDVAGKDKDPNFDVRKNLIGNLGDDIIVFQKSPAGDSLEDVNSRPSVFLISSPNAEQLAATVRALAALAPNGGKLKEREFLGRKIFSTDLPQPGGRRGGGNKAPARTISFTSNGGYLVIATDNAMLEEYLRGPEGKKPLRERPGLAEAAQKVGGMNTGMFAFEDQREGMRPVWTAMKKDKDALANLLAMTPLGGRMGGNAGKTFAEWLDFELLPPFEKVQRHFSIAVYAFTSNQDGIGLKMFNPVSPDLKK